MQALAFVEGISTNFVWYDYGRNFEYFKQQLKSNKFDALFYVAEAYQSYNLFKSIREFVSSGGSAAILVSDCTSSDNLRDTFGISCASPSNASSPGRLPGERLAPLWDGLYLMNECGRYCGIEVEFYSGPSGAFQCVSDISLDSGTVCTTLYGEVGEGKIIFLIAGFSRHYSWFEDDQIQNGDNEEAAVALLKWLTDRN